MRCALLIIIIVVVKQVFKAETSFIKDYRANQAKNSIDCLFNARKNALYIIK